MSFKLRPSTMARRARLAVIGMLAALGLCCTMAGFCLQTPEDVARSTIDGTVIDLNAVDAILADTTLTEAQKREQLLALGVSQDLVDVLVASVQ